MSRGGHPHPLHTAMAAHKLLCGGKANPIGPMAFSREEKSISDAVNTPASADPTEHNDKQGRSKGQGLFLTAWVFPNVLLDSQGCSRRANPGRTTATALPRRVGLSPPQGFCAPRGTHRTPGLHQPPRTAPPQKAQHVWDKQVNPHMRGCLCSLFPTPGLGPWLSKDKMGEEPPSIARRRLRSHTGTKGRTLTPCQRTAGLVLPWMRSVDHFSTIM